MNKLEKDCQKEILEYLKKQGVFCYKHHSGAFKVGAGNVKSGMKGISDIIGVLPNGKFLAIEVKNIGGKISTEQHLFLNNINRNKGVGFIAHNVDEVIKRLKLEKIW